MTVTEGNGIINGQPIKKGDNFIIPNDFGRVEITGKLQAVLSTADKIKEKDNENELQVDLRRVV